MNKPAGLFSQATAGVASLETELIEQLKQTEQHSGMPFVGLPHRLDRETSGVMLIARNQRALKRFGQQFQSRKIGKFYLAVVEATLPPSQADGLPVDCEAKDQPTKFFQGQTIEPVVVARPLTLVGTKTSDSEDARASQIIETWTDWIRKVHDEARAEIVPPNTAGARQAELEAVRVATTGNLSLLLIRLLTGRMHQIRVQAAARGVSVLGDAKYGSTLSFGCVSFGSDALRERAQRSMGLHALRIEFRHPKSGLLESGTAETPATWKQLPPELYQASLALTLRSVNDRNLSWTLRH